MSDVTPILEAIEKRQFRKTNLPDFKVGDTVKVSVLIKEGEKERAQAFEGVVIKKTGAGMRASFTVRKVSYGVGVERVFPTHTPRIEKLDVIARGSVRRARLYYLRDLAGKAARIKAKAGIAHAIIAPTVKPDEVPPST
ncbi:MAG TPA: 50S ribosomal protein L19 [Polyangia bacterium]|jgi:large subunit ribosomal protein L19|nr:50S ribosomal protein L19 [Polyangia bacterium]